MVISNVVVDLYSEFCEFIGYLPMVASMVALLVLDNDLFVGKLVMAEVDLLDIDSIKDLV